jgi:hypothetical protein
MSSGIEKASLCSKKATIDEVKSLNRLGTQAMTECGKRCFANFKTDKISTDENVCLTSCYSKFYDSLELGGKLFDLYSNKDYNISSMMKGRYDELLKNLKL